jgi:hypothetical protein
MRSGLIFGVVILAAVSHAVPQTRNLSRSEDYILLTGADAPSLLDSDPHDLHLYAYGRAGFRAVPFQVDKRDSDGRFVFPDETMRDPLRDGAHLDENDELVFMVKDAGERRPEGAWTDKAVRGVEIELTDPRDGGRAWAYLFERPEAESPITKDYVSYRVEEGRELVASGQYEVGLMLGSYYYDWLRLRRPDGSWSPDLFDRQKMIMKARLLNGAIPLYIPEQQVSSRVLGVIDGPVRVIRNEMNFVKIKLLGLDWITEYFVTYYCNGQISPIEVTIPVTVHKLFLDVSLYYAIDFNEAVLGSTFKNPANPQGILLDWKPDPDIDDRSDNPYMVVTGPQGSLMEVLVLDDLLSQMLIRSTYVEEDLSKEDAQEDHPGKLIAGFYTTTAKRLRKGTYRYWIYHYYPYPFSDQKVQEILNMIEHPVEIKVRPIFSPSIAP